MLDEHRLVMDDVMDKLREILKELNTLILDVKEKLTRGRVLYLLQAAKAKVGGGWGGESPS